MITTEVHRDLVGMKYEDVVQKLEIIKDDGDCCGYAEVDVTLPENTSNLTLKSCVEIQYGYDGNDDQDRKVLNFIFETPEGSELLLGYDLKAGSGSGWSYGAWVKLQLEDRVLVECRW